MRTETQQTDSKESESSMIAKRLASHSLLILPILYLVLMIAGGSRVTTAFRTPHDASAITFVATHAMAIKLGSFLELVSALVLGAFMASAVGRMRFTGTPVSDLQVATYGGVGVIMMLVLSALATWSLTRPGVADAPGAVVVLQSLAFDGGGPGFSIFLGLFVAGVSIAARRQGLIPGWLMWFGGGIATACELAALTLLNFTAGYFIPVGRFGSIVWMICISLNLPARSALESSENR
jgi:hypothetical protein